MKINIHSHSHYSDGANLFEMAKEHKRQGFSAFVVTDHIYPLSLSRWINEDYAPCITSYEQYKRQTSELEYISKELDFPCIQGIELELYNEEVLIFGKQAVKEIFDYIEYIDLQEQKKYGSTMPYKQKIITHLLDIMQKNKDNSAFVLCHPHLKYTPEWMLEPLYKLVDGYEFQNGNTYHFAHPSNINKPYSWNREIPEQLKNKNKFYNSDAHSISSVTKSEGNFHTSKINTLEDLIAYIKTPQQDNQLLLRHQNIISR